MTTRQNQHPIASDSSSMRNRTLKSLWEEFKKQTIPDNASKIQIQEMRNSFYAGALCVMGALSETISEGEEITNEDMSYLGSIIDEAVGYFEKLNKSREGN